MPATTLGNLILVEAEEACSHEEFVALSGWFFRKAMSVAPHLRYAGVHVPASVAETVRAVNKPRKLWQTDVLLLAVQSA